MDDLIKRVVEAARERDEALRKQKSDERINK